MKLLKSKAVQVVASKLRPIVDDVGKQLYVQLMVLSNDMNIDIDSLLKDCKDYNTFWETVSHFYNDYVDNTKIVEELNV